jgi:hypothetical protein
MAFETSLPQNGFDALTEKIISLRRKGGERDQKQGDENRGKQPRAWQTQPTNPISARAANHPPGWRKPGARRGEDRVHGCGGLRHGLLFGFGAVGSLLWFSRPGFNAPVAP